MADAYVGEIRMFAGNFAPTGWFLCEGQIVAISDYQILYSLLGTTYGGNGQTTFGLPDLRGRVPISSGTGNGLTPRVLGQAAGTESVSLTTQDTLPSHTHSFIAFATTATTGTAGPGVGLATATDTTAGQTDARYLPADKAAKKVVPMKAGSVISSGTGEPHDNVMPSTAINFIISLYGIYPSQ